MRNENKKEVDYKKRSKSSDLKMKDGRKRIEKAGKR